MAQIKTVTTTSGTNSIKFDAHYPYIWFKNLGTGDVYVSDNSQAQAGADDTALLKAGEIIRITAQTDTVYVVGATTVEVHAQGFADCPFKKRGKGGESGDIIQNDTPIELFGIYDDEAYIGDVAVIYAEYAPDGKESELHFEITAESTMQWRIYENDSLIRSGTGDENFAIVSPESGIYRIEGDAGMTAKIIPVY